MGKLLHKYFIETTKLSPHQIAIVDSESSISYKHLSQRVFQISELFNKTWNKIQGRQPRVAVIGLKSIESIIAIMASLFTESSYSAISEDLPAVRISEIIDTLSLDILVITTLSKKLVSQLKKITSYPKYILNLGPTSQDSLFQFSPYIKGINNNNVDCLNYKFLNFSDVTVAYILFTSGSTGKPKGVCVSHRSASLAIERFLSDISLTSQDRVANCSSLSFDLSMFDIFSTFAKGATLYLMQKNDLKPDSFFHYIRTKQITSLFTVPSLWRYMQDNRTEEQPLNVNALRYLSFSGEPLTSSFLQSLSYAILSLTQTQVWNLYGATEMPYVFAKRIDPSSSSEMAHCKNFPLHPSIKVRLDAVGQLYIKSSILFSGYLLNNGEQTIKSMAIDGWYPTGDKATINSVGEIELHGRIDRQIKYMGHRIELDEIEERIESLTIIKEAAVIYHLEEKKIIAYVVIGISNKKNENFRKILLEACQKILPTSMIPSSFELIPDIPKTISGKKDRKQLKIFSSSLNEAKHC